MKTRFLALLTLIFCLLCALAFADTARVVTPGGKLNVRKKADDKAAISFYVPNYSLISVEEIEGEWAKITYKKQSGYTKTEYLMLYSALPGKQVYPDSDTVFVYQEPSEDSAITGVLGAEDCVQCLSLEGDFLRVSYSGKEGYVPAEAFSYQYETPGAACTWLWLSGVSQGGDLWDQTGKKAKKTGEISSGVSVSVTQIKSGYAFVLSNESSGWMKAGDLQLNVPSGEGFAPDASQSNAASKALKKAYTRFEKQDTYCEGQAWGEKTLLKYINQEGQLLYAALLGSDNQVILTCDYTAFAFSLPQKELLPEGEISLTLSADTLQTGEVLDITVLAWTEHALCYELTQDGNPVASCDDCTHFTASYRTKQAGDYLLTVYVSDENGLTKTASAAFSVADGADPSPLCDVYSQVDGYWGDVAYQKSTLEHSGCAIFALSHLLQRLGFSGEEIKPENLAQKYAACLTVDGTNNGRLISTAAADFGFKTQKYLIEDKKKIVSLLRKGALFSFAIAKGHIAMVSGISEDGKMIRVVDSAPGATFERIKNASLYYQWPGGFAAVKSLDEIPGIRWYFETQAYGGAEYWLTADYIAKRGVRLVWLQENEE